MIGYPSITQRIIRFVQNKLISTFTNAIRFHQNWSIKKYFQMTTFSKTLKIRPWILWYFCNKLIVEAYLFNWPVKLGTSEQYLNFKGKFYNTDGAIYTGNSTLISSSSLQNSHLLISSAFHSIFPEVYH